MPYRRLPNTDAARLRALRRALEKGREVPPHKLAYQAKTIVRLHKFLPLFANIINLQRQSMTSQNNKSKDYYEATRKARLYLSHFVRVMNMAIYRGDLPEETRAYFGLPSGVSTVPAMNSENELMSWGKRIIEGEEYRLRKGGSPITNPTIALVKVWYVNFLDEYNFHKTITKKTLDYNEKTAEMRKEADQIILEIWNEVEASFDSLPDELKRKACEEYGIVYCFRRSELENAAAGSKEES
ncbi:MAG TPA: hypothetical protein PLV06_08230 [Bacteroidales bacterium]|nr:hypothetical protein [Bacteroidales bacterium]HPJ58669.1 hypothetical protein [Bacteroidales bacterium]HPR12356.1 hypothetical protein [Bacteroidales bacterium]HRW84576.1 hypothetical protein [Bacteroidales bacterium]